MGIAPYGIFFRQRFLRPAEREAVKKWFFAHASLPKAGERGHASHIPSEPNDGEDGRSKAGFFAHASLPKAGERGILPVFQVSLTTERGAWAKKSCFFLAGVVI